MHVATYTAISHSTSRLITVNFFLLRKTHKNHAKLSKSSRFSYQYSLTKMVKLASARESRLYGPRNNRNRWECINSGLYVLAVFLLFAGFTAQLPGPGVSKGGLIVVLIGLILLAAINLHDLVVHMAGIGYRIGMVRYDLQLGLVELLVPFLQFIGSVVIFVGVILLLSKVQ